MSSPCSAIRSWPCFEIGVERVVVDLAAGDDRDLVVQQVDQGADDAGLRLAALAEEDDVLAGEDRVLELRDDGVFEAEDAGEHVLALAHLVDQVAAHLLLDGLHLVAGAAQLTECTGFGCHDPSGRGGAFQRGFGGHPGFVSGRAGNGSLFGGQASRLPGGCPWCSIFYFPY